MQSIVSLLSQKIPDFNKRNLNVNDFWQITEKENIEVIEKLLPVRSFLMTLSDVRVICISNNLSHFGWLESAWHEITHYYCHSQDNFYNILYHARTPSMENRIELEAEAGALIALIPTSELHGLAFDEHDSDYDYWSIITRRRKLFQIYGV